MLATNQPDIHSSAHMRYGSRMTVISSPVRQNQKTGVGLVILLGLLTATGPFSIDLYLPALPSIARHFSVDNGYIQQSMSSFFIGLGIGQLVYGPLSDRTGRRQPLIWGLALFAVASLALVFAPTAEWLIAGRFFQAIGACSGMVIARAVVRDRFETTESARMFSLLMLVLAVAPMLAPSVGALLLAYFGWQSIFVALTILAIGITIASLLWLKETLPPEFRALALNENPLVSYRAAITNREVLGYLLCGAGNAAAMLTYLSGSASLFIGHYNQTPHAFGWIFAFNALGMIIATQINRYALKFYSPILIVRIFTALSALFSIFLLVMAITIDLPMWLCLLMIFLCLSFYGFVSTNGLALALGAMPERAGAISALVGGAAFMAGAGVSFLMAPFANEGPWSMAASLAVGFTLSWAALKFVVRPK